MAWYPTLYRPVHPRANSKGCVPAHIVVAERALGRRLPDGAQVHHVNEDRRDYSRKNLVICQDAAYHKLLHVRAEVVRRGGNPDTDRLCSVCCELKPFGEFWKCAGNKATGLQTQCKSCSRAHQKTYERRAAA